MTLRDRFRYHDENIFFITTTCNQWLNLLSIGNGFEIISENLIFYTKKYNSKVLGYVFMPNHLHLILFFENGITRADFMRDFKKFTSFQIRKEIEKSSPNTLQKIRVNHRKKIFGVWQERYDETYLITKDILETKLEYIHANPLQEKWNLVKYPEEYEYSSARFYETGTSWEIEVTHYADFF